MEVTILLRKSNNFGDIIQNNEIGKKLSVSVNTDIRCQVYSLKIRQNRHFENNTF